MGRYVFFFLGTLGIALILQSSVQANTDLRQWTMADGQTIQGELVDYNPKSDKVVLKLNFKEDREFSFEDFSSVDKAWLVEWVEFVDRLTERVDDLGGTFKHLTTTGEDPTDLFIYYPSAFSGPVNSLPALILFHPGGKAPRYLLRHLEAGEKASLILIACGQFRNSHTEEDEDRFALRWKQVFPQILEKVNFDRKRLFMGGSSGGSSRAFDFSVTTDFPWAGIYSTGGWLGGRDNYDRDYPDGMRVAMVNGNNDKAANHWVESDTEVLEKHDCKVALISFEGGHQVPPTDIQLKAFQWLLEQESFREE